jgi:hypothetical protein
MKPETPVTAGVIHQGQNALESTHVLMTGRNMANIKHD